MLRARKRQADNEQPTTTPATTPATVPPSSLEQLRKHRITRVRRQNEKLALELKKTKGELVPLEPFKAEVIRANTVVKTQFLSLGPRLAPALALVADPREISRLITLEVEQVCNDLAYGTEKSVDEQGRCFLCGAKKEAE
jgi:hypothetical protein